MRLKAAKLDAQTLANHLSSDWLIVRSEVRGFYTLIQAADLPKENQNKIKLRVKPNYNQYGPVKVRVRNYKARRLRELRKHETMREKVL